MSLKIALVNRLVQASRAHSVVTVAAILTVLGVTCTILVLVAPASWALDRLLTTAAAVVTVAAFFIAITIYLAQKSEGGTLSAELQRAIRDALDTARKQRGEDREPGATMESEIRSIKGARVLWVDDRPENCVYEARALRNAGADITFVLTTDGAKAALVASPFDLVISDMGRPEGSSAGYDLLGFVNEYADRTPYILYTSTATSGQVDDARRHGAYTQVSDPWALHQAATSVLLRDPELS